LCPNNNNRRRKPQIHPQKQAKTHFFDEIEKKLADLFGF
jgi:hypothetical protein